MKYSSIKGIDIPISRLIFGTAIDKMMAGENVNEFLDEIYKSGINTFDTARNYKDAEKSLGIWIKERNNRKNIVIISKCAHPYDDGKGRISKEEIIADFNESCKLLNTDYIDIYLLHRDDRNVDVSVPIKILNKLYREGKIKSFGVSNWDLDRIKEANEYAIENNLIPFQIYSPNYCLAKRINDPWPFHTTTLSGDENAEKRDFYAKLRAPILCYSPLGRGFLTGKFKSYEVDKAKEILGKDITYAYFDPENFERLRRAEELAKKKNCSVPQIALAWLFAQLLNIFAIVSFNSISRIKENVDSLNIELTKEECDYLNLKQ